MKHFDQIYKRWLSVILTALILFLQFPLQASALTTIDFTITDFSLEKNDGSIASEMNSIHSGESCLLKIDWSLSSLNAIGGNSVTFHVLDTDISDISWNEQLIADLPLWNGTDQIGTWRLYPNQTIVFNFDSAVTNTSASGTLVIPNIVPSFPNDSVSASVSVGNAGYSASKQILFEAPKREPIEDSQLLNTATVLTSDSIRWNLQAGALSLLSYSNNPAQDHLSINANDFLIKNEFPSGVALSNITITAPIMHFSNISGVSSTTASGEELYELPITSAFTEIMQTRGQTLAAFQRAVSNAPYQWGIYNNNTDGTSTLLVYFGNLPSATHHYSDFTSGSTVGAYLQNALGINAIPNQKADLLDSVYGNNNTLGGNILCYNVHVDATYPASMLSSPQTNTAVAFYTDESASRCTDFRNATSSFSAEPTMNINPGELLIRKFDVDTNERLSNVSFKLQYQLRGSIWSDFDSITNGDGLASIRATDENGEVVFRNLPVGIYRVVEVTSPLNYDSTKTIFTPSDIFEVTASAALGTSIFVSGEKLKYHIFYQADGTETSGASPIDVNDYPIGSLVTVQNQGTLTKTDYVFAGWNTAANRSGMNYFAGSTFAVAYNTSLYAQWDAGIIYHLDGGSNPSTNPQSYYEGHDTIALSAFTDPTKTGYSFAGWYLDSSFTIPFSGISVSSAGPVSLYAKWNLSQSGGGNTSEPRKYTLTFRTNGGSSVASITKTKDSIVTLTQTTEKNRHTFEGWYADEKLTTPITKVTLSKDTTVYAKWSPTGVSGRNK